MKIIPMTPPEYDHFYSFTYWEGECLRWSGSLSAGYPQYRDPATGQRVLAHRWIYSKRVAPIPMGLVIDHVRAKGCEHTDCVRLEHLEAVTHRENSRRSSQAQTHCKNNHEFSPENTYITTNKLGYSERHCRTCQRAASKRYNERKRREKENA